MDSQLQQRLLRSSITREERINVSLILATQIDERLSEVDPALVISALVQLATLLKVLAVEGEITGEIETFVNSELKSINILDIIDLYVAHRPEERTK